MAAPNVPNAGGHSLATRDQALPASVEMAASAAAAQAKAAVESRYLMALQRPRDMERFRTNLLAACDVPAFAEEARYRKPVGKDFVEGWSIRFAEEAARHYGNLLNEATVTFDDDDRRIVRMSVTDLENNLTYPYDAVVEKTVERLSVPQGREVISSRKNSRGQTTFKLKAFGDEIINQQNNQISKGLRNGMMRLISAALQAECLERIQAALSKASREYMAVEKLLAAFLKIGVTEAMVDEYLGHSAESMMPEQFAALSAIGQAIKDGETTWDDMMAHRPAKETPRPQQGVKDGSAGYGVPRKVEPEVIHPKDVKASSRDLGPDPYVGEQPPPPEPQD